MAGYIPPSLGNIAEWQRLVALAVNPALQGYPFPELDTAPSDVRDGYTYFDSTLGKVRTWAGGVWNDHY